MAQLRALRQRPGFAADVAHRLSRSSSSSEKLRLPSAKAKLQDFLARKVGKQPLPNLKRGHEARFPVRIVTWRSCLSMLSRGELLYHLSAHRC